MHIILCLIYCFGVSARWASELEIISSNVIFDLHYVDGVEISQAFRDIALGLPVSRLTLLFDKNIDDRFPAHISRALNDAGIMTTMYTIITDVQQAVFSSYVRIMIDNHEDMTVIIFSSRITAERLISKIISEDLIHRNLLYMFSWSWSDWPVSDKFRGHLLEAMRVALVTSPRPGTYRVYYNQAISRDNNQLLLVNWWSHKVGLFRYPVLPVASKVYHNFHGRQFLIPVLHKPPWNFVEYGNDSSVTVHGGRDDTLLSVLADKLNFRYEYFAPSDRSQGSAISVNGTFQGILGLIWRREVEFCLGDVTITYERSRAVEFSFLTLADSGAFVTRAPGRLNEALALVRSFQWQVWPPVVLTLLFSGPVLFALIEVPTLWDRRRGGRRRRRRHQRDRMKLFWDCIWFITTMFLRQSGREPGTSHKARMFTILLSFAATYVIGDMYSANLTSMLARPGREAPITNLEQLELAMKNYGYRLFVERDGSSYSILKNGTGVYERLWGIMDRQKRSLVESVEKGIQLVRDKDKVVLLGGRETLYFDTRRFGASKFHISEKLYTRYSAIAMQIGCPYLENFNIILMQLFETGILTKMTEEEYEKLGEYLRATAAVKPDVDFQEESNVDKEHGTDSSEKQQTTNNVDERLQPINIKMLQGAFFVLITGYFISGIAIIIEVTSAWRQEHCNMIRHVYYIRRCLKATLNRIKREWRDRARRPK